MSGTKSAGLTELKHTQLGNAANTAYHCTPWLFESVYKTHYALVHTICRRILRDPMEAEDATQDVFIRVFLKLHSFRGESALSSWLYRIAVNVALMRLRQNCPRPISPEEFTRGDRTPRKEIGKWDANLSALLDRVDLEVAVGLLPKGYRTTLFLHDFQGYKHDEIARIFGYSTGNSKSQLHKARRRLRELLDDAPKRNQIRLRTQVP